MNHAELQEDLATTAANVAEQLRAAILAGNAGAAREWAAALRDATNAYSTLLYVADAVDD